MNVLAVLPSDKIAAFSKVSLFTMKHLAGFKLIDSLS
jgi:hypothetical protein